MSLHETDPQYSLFFKSHYKTIKKQSLRPMWSRGSMIFTSQSYTVKKNLTIIDKIKYYLKDLKLWYEIRKYDNSILN